MKHSPPKKIVQKQLKAMKDSDSKMNIDVPTQHVKPKRYVTQGLPDYVTLLKSRKSGQSLLDKL